MFIDLGWAEVQSTQLSSVFFMSDMKLTLFYVCEGHPEVKNQHFCREGQVSNNTPLEARDIVNELWPL